MIFVFAILLAAIAGFPPFPGFWAKWHLVMNLAAGERYPWIAIVLLGSLLEATYLFRWFGRTIHSSAQPGNFEHSLTELLPVFAAALLLVVSGYYASILADPSSAWIFLPLVAGLVLYFLDGLAGQVKGILVFGFILTGGFWLIHDLSGINYLFAVLLYAGGLVLSIACLYRSDARRGFYPLLAVMLLSLPALPRATTSLEFLFIWELITLSSYFLIVRRREAAPHALRYLLFSLVSAFFLLAGFAMAYAINGNISLAALRAAGPDSSTAFVLLAIGLLIKAGAIGVHVWLPGAYAEADDDVSAMLSAVISKVPIFGLLVGTYLAIRSEVSLNLAQVTGMDRHAHNAGRRHDGGAPGRHEAHAGLFEHEPARLHHNRHRADEPSRLGHSVVPCGQSPDGQRNPVSRRRSGHSSHRYPHVRRYGRPRQAHAVHVRGRGRGDRCDVGPATAHRASAANGFCSAR